MEIKKTKILNKENLSEVIGYKDVEVYKNLVDFDAVYLNKNHQYEIYGLKKEVSVNDCIYLDLAIWKDSNTFIYGKVVKVLKTKIVINYVYVDLL